MNKVLIHKDSEGVLNYAVVTSFGVKPFGANKASAISCASHSSVWHNDYVGSDTEVDYKMWQERFGHKYIGEFFVGYEGE